MTLRIFRPRDETPVNSPKDPSKRGTRVIMLLLSSFALITGSAPLGCTSGDNSAPSLDTTSLETVLAIRDDFQRSDRLIEILSSATESDEATLSSRVRDRYRPIDSVDHLLLVKAWAGLAPAAATKWARAAAPDNINEAAVEDAVRAWAKRDPEAAAELPVGEPNVARPLVAGWFDSEKPGLADFVLSRGALEEGQTLIAAYLRELIAREGPSAATDWAASVQGEDGLVLAVLRHTGKELATLHPDAAIAFCDRHCDGPSRTVIRILVARRLGQTGEGRKAVEWLIQSETGYSKEKGQAIRAAYLGWLSDERNEALAWAETALPEYGTEAWFQHVIGLFVSTTSWNEPERALLWADRIKDPERKQLALITIARRWRDHDPVAAEAWLMASPLSEESRSVARKYPKNYPRRPQPRLPLLDDGQ